MAGKVIDNIRASYDALAAEYARRLFDELRHKPFDRDLLDRFARQVSERGPVCDLGCGPGQVARHLKDAGTPVFGLDLSPKMVEVARSLSPDIDFREGDMLALDLASQSLGGIVAFYAIVNLPEALLPTAFREMARVLRPDGVLLLSFHAGADVIAVEELWGQPIAMEFRYFDPARIGALLAAEGFAVEEILERDPYPEVEYQSRRTYLLAGKPAA